MSLHALGYQGSHRSLDENAKDVDSYINIGYIKKGLMHPIFEYFLNEEPQEDK